MTAQLTTEQKVLLRAADLLDERGWFQGGVINPSNNGPLCALLALSKAKEEFKFKDTGYVLREKLGVGPLVPWNDAPERTKEEVQAVFRRAASEWETSSV